MEENTFINVSKDMMSFIEKSPTAFQVTANFMDLLDDAGFVRLNERDRWHLIQRQMCIRDRSYTGWQILCNKK